MKSFGELLPHIVECSGGSFVLSFYYTSTSTSVFRICLNYFLHTTKANTLYTKNTG